MKKNIENLVDDLKKAAEEVKVEEKVKDGVEKVEEKVVEKEKAITEEQQVEEAKKEKESSIEVKVESSTDVAGNVVDEKQQKEADQIETEANTKVPITEDDGDKSIDIIFYGATFSPYKSNLQCEFSEDLFIYRDQKFETQNDDEWGYVNRDNIYNDRGFEDDEFGYQNANFVGNDNYGYGNVRNDGYENNRQPRNNNQWNRNDGFYNNNNNNNINPNRIPRFVGGGNQRGNQGGNRKGDRGGERRDNRRPVD
ncbi:GATA zinc finger domain-containing protein 15-like [Helianthus annuus]|uniref:GATA zinc finger domain-containing protein 15-like n=1 Tax=Helianthus annuus TaxID=4232 RepID=UPI000B8F593C|nr:GATA zinc finger domain-containing protein 15-like [Helianthus annuus]